MRKFPKKTANPLPAEESSDGLENCNDALEEWNVQTEVGSPISLKSPEEVYTDMYAAAYEKAKQMKGSVPEGLRGG